nr:hypothetical protein [Planctomycetota bacterium]
RRRGDLDGDAIQALVLITDRLDGIADGAVAAGFADLAVHADRELAIAAATVLSQGARWDLPLPVDTIAGRANGVADFALRHALIGLLLRLKPDLVREVAGADSPWRQLASHRERLAAWEWEGMVR